ncbi:NmrA family NAD(P)-binding protein [Virgisporangium aurantiacum]|nr:NAD(P)H-binding protein [Virgisporangium aurantiacum]
MNLILGGTGKTGRRIVERLRDAGRPVRAVARPLFDLGDPGTWAPALAGATAAYLVEPDVQAAGAHGPDRLPRLVTEAVDAGVRRLVLLTAGGAGHDGHPLKPVEEAVRRSGVGWTILRPTWFAQNFSESMWRPGVLSGTLALPTGDGRTPFVDADDIASVAVAALTDDRHHEQVYVLTGPRALTFGEAAALISGATGRVVRHVDVEPAAYTASQVASGVPPVVAEILTGVYRDIRAGHGADLADGVERALGRPAGSFEDYVTRAASAKAWGPTPRGSR